MDIAALSMVSANMQVRQDASILMLRKAMETTEANSIGLQQMMQPPVAQSIDPKLGNRIDISV